MRVDGNVPTALFGMKYKWVRLLTWLGFMIALVGVLLLGTSLRESLYVPTFVVGVVMFVVFGVPRDIAYEQECRRVVTLPQCDNEHHWRS